MILKEKHILIILFFNCITGPSLPYGLYDSAMAESPDGRGVILFGGDVSENSYKHENRISNTRLIRHITMVCQNNGKLSY